MAQFVNIYPCDLRKGPVETSLKHMYLGDVEANRVGVNVTDGGEAVALSGTCSGTAILCNGGTVGLTGVISGNQAYIDMPAAVYTVEGPVDIYLAVTTNGVTTTLLHGYGNAVRTDSGVVIDPGTIIPSVAALISDIDEAVASIPADYSDLLGTIAPNFSSSTAYTAGQYVWYSGTLYRFTSDHAAGSWTGTDAISAEIGEDVADLKGAIMGVEGVLDIDVTPSKNLNKTPFPSETKNSVTFTVNPDKSVSMSGNPSGAIYYNWPAVEEYKWLLPAGTYTLSGGLAKRAVTLDLFTNKSDTSIAVQKSSGSTANTFTTNSDYWAWIHFDILSDASTDGITLYPQVEAGSEATAYQSPDAVTYSSTVLDGITEEMTGLSSDVDGLGESVNDLSDEVTGLSASVSGITEAVVGKNKVDPSKLVTGYIQSDGTVATNGAYANYSTSDFIVLEEDTDYVFSNYNSSGNLRTSESVACVLFDESKTVIANSYQNVSGTGYLTFNSGDNAKYARVTTKTSGSYFQLESGRTTPSAYEAYTAHDVIALPLGDAPTEQVQEQIDDAINNSGIIQFETGKNLVDPSRRVTGYIQSNGSVSTEGSYANYSTSDYIELEENTDYVFAGFGETSHGLIDYNRVACLLFDDSKTQITGTYQDLSSSTAHGVLTFNSGTTAKFARVTTKTDAIFQLEKGTTPTMLEEYRGQYVVGYPLGSTPFTQSQTGNILFGKKWAVCGDSFTDGATTTQITDDGIYKGARYVYPYLIGNRNYMKIEKFFNGGRTLAFPAEPGSFTNSLTNPNADFYYQNIPADADYITIYLGINDANHASGSSIDGESTEGLIPLGEITDSTTATYYGAWNVVLTWLITNRPNAHIGIIVCNGNATNDNYRLAQIAIAQKYGIPYIDLNGDERTPAMIRTSNPNIASAVKTALIEKWRVSSSNTHPNDAAHLFESTFIENFLRSI